MHTKAEAVTLTEDNLNYLRETFTHHKNPTDWLEQRWEETQETGELLYIVRYEDRNEFEKVMGIGFGTAPENFVKRNLRHFNIVDRYTETVMA